MRVVHPYRGARRGAAVVLATAGIAAGVVTARVAAQVAAPRPAPTMAGMPMTRGQAQGQAGAPTTVVRLHQRVVRVTIQTFAFRPARLVVSPGTRLVWVNKDSDPHTVDSTTGIWSSEALDTDGQFARVFRKTGTFAYYCSIHPFMHGTIVVKK